ncbi:MAG: acetate uptake transporter [Acidobacteriota bacterium]|nr:acetate uptake transporter [Acidobacteriota bacterium]
MVQSAREPAPAFGQTTVGKPVAEPPVQPDLTVADPAPLGLAAFALTTFVLSLANANVWHATDGAVALALGYGGLAQLLAGMWEFKRNNTFGATAFSSYGAFWISYFVLAQFILKSVPKADVPGTVGTFLLAWGIFTLYMIVASLRVSGAVAGVFVLLTVTFFLLAIGNFETSTGWIKAGGWFGVATAAVAWYASFAGVTNTTFKRVVLPVYPLAR